MKVAFARRPYMAIFLVQSTYISCAMNLGIFSDIHLYLLRYRSCIKVLQMIITTNSVT